MIYRHLADTGAAPTPVVLERWVGGPATARRLLGELQQRHALVVDQSGRIRMALPFSGVATTEAFAHFAIPARHWWDDIVET